MKKLKIIVFAIALFSCGLALGQNEPHAFYLTWQEDPTTTITIDWHTDETASSEINIRRKGLDEWSKVESDVLPYPFSERLVHRASIKNLRPETSYEIKFPGSEEVYYFNTLPLSLDKRSLKIAIGGDSMHRKEWLEKTNKVVASYEPDFIIIGGDMAYENGLADNVERIYDFFDSYKNTLVTADNRILPCIVAVGNHEVVGGYHTKHNGYEQTDAFRSRIAPYFYALFPFPGQPGYNVLDVGTYLSLIILDTEHSNPILGVQTEWLEKTLAERKHVLHRIPVYHVPAYPSVRKYEDNTQTLVRENWVPIFEKNGIKLAFENHDHAYKRTFPILDGEVNQGGIVYVGDGSWGTEPREIHDVASTWYLKNAQSINAFTLLTLEGSQFSLVSIDSDGNIIDSFPENPLAK
ncbi:fibronectin type III domain-containing protein [Belliella marina]|uniref:Fibronectin type III domain-containing protein n=1 Tax=Belliella marina TaxID=1644146 RepID=A0ABW4VL51_9BACT